MEILLRPFNIFTANERLCNEMTLKRDERNRFRTVSIANYTSYIFRSSSFFR